MIVIGNTVLSDDLVENEFVCNLEKCKGACCVEGDNGAPLTEEECEILDAEFDNILPFITEQGRDEIEKQGKWILDSDGDLSTPTINGRECAYAIYEKNGHLKCGIENAYKAGKTTFRKPISCHLYPIRITQYDHYEALNYHRWHICKHACNLGKELQVPLYVFLKEALIRKYGESWYQELENEVNNSLK